MPNHAIIALGSNTDSKENIAKAQALLKLAFNNIRFSDPVYTEPINIPNPSFFLNMVATLDSSLNEEEIKSIFKKIEKEMGRNLSKNIKYQIIIDIDLIKWGNKILKADDFNRKYIQEGIASLI